MFNVVNPKDGQVTTVHTMMEATSLCCLFNTVNGLHRWRDGFVDANGQPAVIDAAYAVELKK